MSVFFRFKSHVPLSGEHGTPPHPDLVTLVNVAFLKAVDRADAPLPPPSEIEKTYPGLDPAEHAHWEKTALVFTLPKPYMLTAYGFTDEDADLIKKTFSQLSGKIPQAGCSIYYVSPSYYHPRIAHIASEQGITEVADPLHRVEEEISKRSRIIDLAPFQDMTPWRPKP